MSDYTPTTEEILRAYRLPRPVPPQRDDESFSDYLSRLSIGTMHDQIESEVAARRWLAQHDADLLASIVPEEIRTHWEWTEQRRTRFKDRDCMCGACQMMANIAKITGRSEGGA